MTQRYTPRHSMLTKAPQTPWVDRTLDYEWRQFDWVPRSYIAMRGRMTRSKYWFNSRADIKATVPWVLARRHFRTALVGGWQ